MLDLKEVIDCERTAFSRLPKPKIIDSEVITHWDMTVQNILQTEILARTQYKTTKETKVQSSVYWYEQELNIKQFTKSGTVWYITEEIIRM